MRDFEGNGWIQTYTGLRFWPLQPSENDIEIEDIAHALSMKCRYSGHCHRFYSVAEHSVVLSRLIDPRYAIEALLHDAAEAYLSDVPRPIKPLLTGFKEIEEAIERAIAKKYGLTFPWPDAVKEADTRILADEKAQLMGPEPAPWHLPLPPFGVTLECWSPERARTEFMARWAEFWDA